jgi:glycosyltransferase involved in cell wall biosynthesis
MLSEPDKGKASKLKVALLMTDAREHWREYGKSAPYFGTAPAALLNGLALLPEEVEVHVVSCTQRPMSSPEKLAPNIWFHSLLVPKLGWLRTGYQGCIRASRKKLRQIGPDCVHAQGTERDCAISGVLSGFPNLLTLHGNMRLIATVNRARPFSFTWLAARLETFTLPRTGGVICLSRYTQQAISDLVRRTWLVPNAVESSFFDLERAENETRTILCVGHISQRKNQLQLIKALDPIAERERLQVLFLGLAPAGDPYCAEFHNMIGVRPWCTYGGLADRDQLKDHLRRSMMLVLPSLEDNCPMAVLEAMAAGAAVIVARVGGLPDLVHEEINGLFCDPDDVGSIRSTILRLTGNPTLRAQLAARAKQLAMNQYHPAVIARQHLNIYRELLTTDS